MEQPTKPQEAKQPKRLRVHPIVAVIIVLFLLGIGALIGSDQKPQENAANAMPAEGGNSTDAAETQTPQLAATNMPLTINDKLWEAFNKIYDDRYKKGTDIKYTNNDKTAILIQYPGKYWSETNLYDLDETRLVESAISTFVRFGQEAFTIDDVNRVGVDYRMPFTDTYGKETTSTAFSFSMTKVEFQRYNWDNLKGKPIYSQIIRSTEDDPMFSIDPSVLRKINPDEITLY